jgi:two-component system CheB/CheR fusion protein
MKDKRPRSSARGAGRPGTSRFATIGDSANRSFASLVARHGRTNHELASAKAKLVSIGEELRVLNADLAGLLEAVEVAVVLLDAAGCVRRFTREAGVLLKLTTESVGRPIDSVARELHAPDLQLWVAQAMRTGATVESEVEHRILGWRRLRIRPHHALDRRADGAVLTLVRIPWTAVPARER